ncbi:MAG: energy transducer TonB [Spirochaetales bacterium]|jgi:protein TonB|nr:energy transducer TonB [Spirochaetales bacterium]
MNTEKKIKLGILTASAAIHILILFFLVFDIPRKQVSLEEASFFSMVNIAELPEIPPAIPPPAAARRERPPAEPVPVQEEIAETFVETEEEPEPAAETGIAAEGEADNAGSAEGLAGNMEGSAAAAQYIRENYQYVQRRILQHLEYPSRARRTGLQGVVEITFTINMNGSTSNITVKKSCGHEILDEEALRAVRSASPFRRPETPVRITIPISFKLT